MRRILLFIAAALAAIDMHAGKDKKETYQVHINMPDHSIRANVMAGTVTVKADIDRTYYWYASNRIMGTLGGYDGKLLHGDYTSFYLGNNLKEKGTFQKGLKHGKWISWYDNGQIKDITSWRNGRREGNYYSFTEAGLPVLQARFSNDVLHGRMTSYEGGKILSRKKYRNGKEIIKKEKQPRIKKAKTIETTDEPISKEGINTATLNEKENKRTWREKLRSLAQGKKNDDSEKKLKTKKPRSKKPPKQENK